MARDAGVVGAAGGGRSSSRASSASLSVETSISSASSSWSPDRSRKPQPRLSASASKLGAGEMCAGRPLPLSGVHRLNVAEAGCHRYRLQRWLALALGFQYEEQDSSQQFFDHTRNQLFVTVSAAL